MIPVKSVLDKIVVIITIGTCVTKCLTFRFEVISN